VPILFTLLSLLAAPVASDIGLKAADRPGDGGGAIVLSWNPAAEGSLTGWEILRQAEGDTWQRIDFRGPRADAYTDEEALDGIRYRYALAAVDDTASTRTEPTGWVKSSPQWYDPSTTGALVGTLVICFFVVYFVRRARAGHNLFVRRISGLDAVEEALGRATEMGRPILFVPGLSTVSDVATIAALNILGEVAKKTAGFGTPLVVPTADPIVYTVAQETVKQSYTTAGRPDAFDPGSVYFVTDEQFAYAAAVDGIMARERPATNFLIGMFWAESLIIAETGAQTGAIQIAGTDAINQLPFFITACDYTLIGEELYAASAYLSREPLLLGALVAQDYSKLLILILTLGLTLLALVAGIETPSLLG
jgi:hypothetical protein